MSISLRTADILPIVGFSKEEFAAWLEDGIRSRASMDPATLGRAFYPIHNLMAGKPVPDRLEEIYWALPDAEEVKSKLRQGLADAFERLARDHDLYAQLNQLLHFAELIIADELAPRLLGVFTEVGAGADKGRLLSQALTYLSSLRPFVHGPEIIRDLITLPDASPKVAVFAWLMMCRCDPTGRSAYLAALRERISLALKPYSGSNNLITGARFASRGWTVSSSYPNMLCGHISEPRVT